MTLKVGPKGQVVIPKRIRDAIGIRPGDEVTVEARGADEAVVRRAPEPERLLGLLSDGERVGMRDFEEEKRRERRRELGR